MKNWFQIGILIALFSIAGSVGYYYLYYLPNQTSSTQTASGIANLPNAVLNQELPTQAPQPEKSKTFTLTSARIGQPFTVNGLEYTVTAAKNVGSDLSKLTVTPKPGDFSMSGPSGMGTSKGGTFVLVKLSVKNNGVNATSGGDTVTYLKDSVGRNFTSASAFDFVYYYEAGYEQLNSSGLSFTVVKPGFTSKMFFLAEVASDSNNISIIIANQSDQNFTVPLGF